MKLELTDYEASDYKLKATSGKPQELCHRVVKYISPIGKRENPNVDKGIDLNQPQHLQWIISTI